MFIFLYIHCQLVMKLEESMKEGEMREKRSMKYKGGLLVGKG